MFYNTTGLKNPTLFDAVNTARKQDDKILEFFSAHKGSLYSPCDVHKSLFHDTLVPLTSCRRSISNLTTAGKLIKTDQYKNGVYGKKTYLWKFNSDR